MNQKSNKSNIYQLVAVRAAKFLDVILVLIPFSIFWLNQSVGRYPLDSLSFWVIQGLFTVFYIWLCRTYDGFYIQYSRISELVYSQILAIIVTDGIMYILYWLLNHHMAHFGLALITLICQIMLIFLWAFTVHKWYFRVFQSLNTYVIWDSRKDLMDVINNYTLEKKFTIIGNCTASECVKNLHILDSSDVVFLSGIHSHDRNIIIKYCVEHHILAFMIPRIGDVIMSGAEPMHLFHLPILRLSRYNPTPEYLFIKRFSDIVLSGIGLIITSPIMFLTAIAIKTEDGGPVFYKQTRLTKNGQEFEIIKFRSMRTDAEKDGKARLSTGENDNRITKTGRFIRAVRIDELPQLINILKGDMSIVGPRPERPEIAEEYEKELPEFKLRLQTKCGLTGYAQVYGKYNTAPYDKLQMDLMYIANPSLIRDLEIILATIKILFKSESTEGISIDKSIPIEDKVDTIYDSRSNPADR